MINTCKRICTGRSEIRRRGGRAKIGPITGCLCSRRLNHRRLGHPVLIFRRSHLWRNTRHERIQEWIPLASLHIEHWCHTTTSSRRSVHDGPRGTWEAASCAHMTWVEEGWSAVGRHHCLGCKDHIHHQNGIIVTTSEHTLRILLLGWLRLLLRRGLMGIVGGTGA